MKIEFNKISQNGIDFETKNEEVVFLGTTKKINKKLIKCMGTIEGSFIHCCDRCGCDFEQNIRQSVEIYASNGYYKDDHNYINLIEFFDGFINFDTMLQSELESLKCDYLYCDKCNK